MATGETAVISSEREESQVTFYVQKTLLSTAYYTYWNNTHIWV